MVHFFKYIFWGGLLAFNEMGQWREDFSNMLNTEDKQGRTLCLDK